MVLAFHMISRIWPPRRWLGAVLAGLLGSFCLSAEYQGPDGGQQSLEYRVKAAFLLNFTKFVEWPAPELPDSKTFGICIIGNDPFGPVLDRIVEGETVSGRKLTVWRTRTSAPKACQVIFVSGSERDQAQIISGAGPGVLTIGEGGDFLQRGGMIAFVIENRRVRFDVDLTAAAKAGLKISSKLLNVARSVEE